MINLSRNFLRAFLRRAFSAGGLFLLGGRSRLSRRRSPKKRRIAFAGEEGGAFMIFCGLGKECGLSRVLHDRRRRAASVAVSSGLRGGVSFIFPPRKNGAETGLLDLTLPTGKGGHLPRRAVRRRPWWLYRAGRQRRRSVRHAGGALGGGGGGPPAACNLFRRSAFLRCSGGGSDGAASCPVDRADARVYPREK